MLHGEETVHYESLLTRISFLIVCCLNERGKIKIPEKIIYEFPVASPSCGLPLKKQDSLIQKKKINQRISLAWPFANLFNLLKESGYNDFHLELLLGHKGPSIYPSIHPSIHSPAHYIFMESWLWLRAILDAGDMAINKTEKTLLSGSLYFCGRNHTVNKLKGHHNFWKWPMLWGK